MIPSDCHLPRLLKKALNMVRAHLNDYGEHTTLDSSFYSLKAVLQKGRVPPAGG